MRPLLAALFSVSLHAEDFTWKNPCTGGPDWIRDAFVIRVDDTYTLLTPDKPITGNNDASLFFDEDGKDHLVQTSFNLAPIDLEKLELTGPKVRVIQGGAVGEWDDAAKINEGSCLLKIKGTYYYFWSCNSWGYFVGYATSSSINGPWTKNPNNPIWGAAKPAFREKAGQPADLPFNEVGHGTPFIGPGNRLWIAGHGHVINGPATPPYNSPRPCFDPLDFDPATGRISGKLSHETSMINIETSVSPPTLGSILQLPLP